MNDLILIPRDKKENNRQYAYRLLRYNILNLVLTPGETLNENELSQMLNVSRTPVHEALLQLEADDLVNIVPQSGSYVTLISMKKVREGLFFRTTLEPAIIRQLAGNISQDTLKELHDCLEEMFVLIKTAENEGTEIPASLIIENDNHFHHLTYLACQKSTIWEMRGTVCSHFDRIRYQGSVEKLDRLNRVYSEHRKIYEFLLLGGDPDFDLEDFYSKHLSHFKDYYNTAYNKHPDYFTV